jgi:uncharacterized protein YndB with AHSA1/START domain
MHADPRPDRLAGGQPDINGRLETRDDRHILIFERRLPHSVERVWRAITEQDELRHWFPGVPGWTLEVGSTFEVEGQAGSAGEIVELEPPRLLAFDWDADRLRFELQPDGDGCLLTFTHAFGARELGAQTAAGWDLCFDRLAALLDDAPITEAESMQGSPALHERYAEHFGIDPELGRRAFAEHANKQ